MALSPAPFVKPQFFDSNGDPAASYRLFFYDAGTSTKRDTYQDADQSAANTNPVVLDSAGRANIFLLPTLYKIVYAAPGSDDPPSSPVWTVDDVGSSGAIASNVDIPGTAGENLTAGQACYIANVTGGGTPGRWYRTDTDAAAFADAAGNDSIVIGFPELDVTSGDIGSFRIVGIVTGLSGLTTGATHYLTTTAGTLTSVNPSPTNLAFPVGTAISATALVLNQGPPEVAGVVNQVVLTGTVNQDTQYFYGDKHFVEQPSTTIGAGGAGGVEGVIGGVFFRDVTEYPVAANSTDLVLTNTTIPANMLDINGRTIWLKIGNSTAEAGANAKLVELDVGGTQVVIRTSTNTNNASWQAHVEIIRIDSDSVDVCVQLEAVSTVTTLITRINSLTFTAAIALRTLGTTGAASTTAQTHFIAWAV